MARDILGGICDIGVGNTYYMGGLINETDPAKRAWGEAVQVVLPSFKGGGVWHTGWAKAQRGANRQPGGRSNWPSGMGRCSRKRPSRC